MKIDPKITPRVAVNNFITEWCYKCDILDLLRGRTLCEVNPLCPLSTLSTCPTYKKILLLQSVTGTATTETHPPSRTQTYCLRHAPLFLPEIIAFVDSNRKNPIIDYTLNAHVLTIPRLPPNTTHITIKYRYEEEA